MPEDKTLHYDRLDLSLPTNASSAHTGTFARTGEYWSITFDGVTFSAKDTKGPAYIQLLLQHPGEKIHAMNLVHGVSGASSVGTPLTVTALTSDSRTVTGRLGDAGPMLDARAKREYRQRLRDLKEELKELRKSGDLERGEKVEAEIDFIEREILRAVGFRGRDRRARSAAERARLGVSRAIKRALHRISDHQPLLGKLLDKSIKTGLFSVYDPRRADAVAWRYTLEPAERISEPEPSACIAPTFIKVPADADTAHSAFVGREAESAVLRHHLDRLRRGSGSVVLSDIERLTYR